MTLLNRLGLAALLLPLLGAAPGLAGAQDTHADWLKQPSKQDLMTVWPAGAMKRGLGGKAQISCTVTVQGALRGCRVTSESPAGQGFGGAALTLAAQFQMKPATRNGQPMESQVAIPIVFPDFDIPTGSHMHGQSLDAGIPIRVISGLRWSQAPSFSDVLAAYPEKAKGDKLGGRATLDCVIGKGGSIGHCGVLQEEPASNGFGSAARKLATKFIGPTTDQKGASLMGVHTQVPIVFAAGSLTDTSPLIGKPQWTALPNYEDMVAAFPAEARAAGLRKARVVLSCTVVVGGALADCGVVSEEPAGHGIAKATLGLTKTFRLGVWASEGLPTVGGVVRVPIRYDFTEDAKP